MRLGQQQDHASSPAKNSTPTDQLQRKPVGAVVLGRQRGMTRGRRLADRSCRHDATLEVRWQNPSAVAANDDDDDNCT